jgi:hypothetical protein
MKDEDTKYKNISSLNFNGSPSSLAYCTTRQTFHGKSGNGGEGYREALEGRGRNTYKITVRNHEGKRPNCIWESQANTIGGYHLAS